MSKTEMSDVQLRELAFLVNAVDMAKEAKKFAEEKLVLAESKVAARIEADEDSMKNNRNSQRTVSLLDGRKVTVARKFNLKADLEGIKSIVFPKSLPSPIKKEKKVVEALDLDGYKWYKINEPAIFAKISQFVTATPAKASITIKPPKDES